MAVLEKLEAQEARERQAQQVQTDTGPRQTTTSVLQPKDMNFFSGKTMTVQIKKNAFQLTLK